MRPSATDKKSFSIVNCPIFACNSLTLGPSLDMSELILQLCKEILDLAETQKEAIIGGRFDELNELQEKRQLIIEKIQKFDSIESSGGHFDVSGEKDDRVKEEFSRWMNVIVEKTLSIDREIETIIHRDIDSLVGKMETVQKLKKAFCQGAGFLQPGRKLNVNA